MRQQVGWVSLLALFGLLAITPVFAGEYFERDGVAIGGYDRVASFTEMKSMKRSSECPAEYQRSTVHFVFPDHRDTVLADPPRYASRYGGCCAYGMAKGDKALIDPTAFTVVGDTLYLNDNVTVRTRWIFGIQGCVKKAEQYWPDVRRSTSVTP